MAEMIAAQFPSVPAGEVVLRLVVATLLGGLVGLEREVREKPAGLRTFAMVSLGSAAFVLAVMQAGTVVGEADWQVRYDPTRLVSAVATGIGFLGAGAIFNAGRNVHGLTTGAGIWIAGAIGVACGVGQLALALVVTVLTIFVLVVFRVLERFLA